MFLDFSPFSHKKRMLEDDLDHQTNLDDLYNQNTEIMSESIILLTHIGSLEMENNLLRSEIEALRNPENVKESKGSIVLCILSIVLSLLMTAFLLNRWIDQASVIKTIQTPTNLQNNTINLVSQSKYAEMFVYLSMFAAAAFGSLFIPIKISKRYFSSEWGWGIAGVIVFLACASQFWISTQKYTEGDMKLLEILIEKNKTMETVEPDERIKIERRETISEPQNPDLLNGNGKEIIFEASWEPEATTKMETTNNKTIETSQKEVEPEIWLLSIYGLLSFLVSLVILIDPHTNYIGDAFIFMIFFFVVGILFFILFFIMLFKTL